MQITKGLAAAALTLCAFAAHGATIYGTLTDGNGAPMGDERIELRCPGEVRDWRNTDRNGKYRLTVSRAERCEVIVKNATAAIVVYDSPTEYNFKFSDNPLSLTRLKP